MNHREPGEFGDGATIMTVHTPKQVSAERLQQIVAYVDLMGPNSEPCVPGDVAQSMAAELLTRRSSAGVKVTDEMVERFHQFLEETGAWVVPRITIRAALTAALALPSHAGEDDGAVAELVHAALNVFDKLASETATVSIFDQERLGDAIKATISGRHPSPSVPPQGETSREASIVRMAEVLDGCLHFKDGNSLVWATRLYDAALASQTQGGGSQHPVYASAERIAAAYRINLDEPELRRWAFDAVKAIRVMCAITPSPTLEPSDAEVERAAKAFDDLEQKTPYGKDQLYACIRAALIASRQPTSGEGV